MALRKPLELVAAMVALALCGAFVISFIAGLRGDAKPVPLVLDPPAIAEPAADAGKVEVLNGSGRTGAARAVTDRLRAAGFDVVYFGNTAADSSVVIARVANAAVARAAARRLGIAGVRTELDSTLFLDATVVLGKDWR
jgi:hypothetical protein